MPKQLAETDHTVLPHGHAGTVNTTNKIDMNAWMKLPRVTNSINGYNDGTWGQVRKKFSDLESSARELVIERRKTGGGKVVLKSPITEEEQTLLSQI